MRQRLGKSFFSSVVYFVISLFSDFILILLFHSPRLWLNLRVLDICLRFACQTKWFLFLCCCSVVIYLFIREFILLNREYGGGRIGSSDFNMRTFLFCLLLRLMLLLLLLPPLLLANVITMVRRGKNGKL